MRKRRATDCKTNQRVYLPDPRPAREEAELMVRSQRMEEVMRRYMKEKCNDKGEIVETNLTDQEKRGIKKLLKRVKDGEVVLSQTDKSGKLCLNTMENYISQGRSHINGDREVQWREVQQIQKRITAHARVMVKIFNVGEAWGENNQKRINGAYSTETCIVPALSTLPKDHKPIDGEVPNSRPVANASTSINGRMSDLSSDILMPVAQAQDSDECISGEDMLYHIREANKKIMIEGKNVIVASQDVN